MGWDEKENGNEKVEEEEAKVVREKARRRRGCETEREGGRRREFLLWEDAALGQVSED